MEAVKEWQKLCAKVLKIIKCKPLKGEKLKEMEEYLDGRNH